jgi:hypothetical protein
MAKVKIKNIYNVRDLVKKEFDKIRRDPILLGEIGKLASTAIIKSNQTGKSPKTGETFKRLSQSWFDQRSYLESFNQTGDFYLSTKKSNVTFSGQLLRAFKSFVVNSYTATVTISPEGAHSGYKTKSGRTKSVPFKKLLTYLADQGRVAFGFSADLEKRIKTTVRTFVRRAIIKSKF